jgi:hypothetical protein
MMSPLVRRRALLAASTASASSSVTSQTATSESFTSTSGGSPLSSGTSALEADGLIVLLAMLCPCVHSLTTPLSKQTLLDLLLAFSSYLDDRTKPTLVL